MTYKEALELLWEFPWLQEESLHVCQPAKQKSEIGRSEIASYLAKNVDWVVFHKWNELRSLDMPPEEKLDALEGPSGFKLVTRMAFDYAIYYHLSDERPCSRQKRLEITATRRQNPERAIKSLFEWDNIQCGIYFDYLVVRCFSQGGNKPPEFVLRVYHFPDQVAQHGITVAEFRNHREQTGELLFGDRRIVSSKQAIRTYVLKRLAVLVAPFPLTNSKFAARRPLEEWERLYDSLLTEAVQRYEPLRCPRWDASEPEKSDVG